MNKLNDPNKTIQAGKSTLELPLSATDNRTGDVWHVMLPNLDASLLYGYRVAGPHQERKDSGAGNVAGQR